MPDSFKLPPPVSIEASNSDNWVRNFLQQHYLEVGAEAWKGRCQWGRGMVVCEIDVPIERPISWWTERIPHHMNYVPLALVSSALETLELTTTVHDHLRRSVLMYQMSAEIVLLVLSASGPLSLLLQNLEISPAQCYRQWQSRRIEFVESGQ